MESDAGAETPFFVGREPEIGRLAATVRDAQAGRGRPALLVGEPGIGKTRTVEELASRINMPPERIIWGRSPEQEGAPAYWPWLQILRRHLERSDAARIAAEFGPDAVALSRLLPGLGERLGVAKAAREGDAAQSRFLLFEAVAATLRRAAAQEPLLLVLEDLHWADETSVNLLLFVAEEMRGARFALVSTCRPQAAWRARGLFADLARKSLVVDLGGLEHSEVARLVARAGGGEVTSATLVDVLRDATGGNPFFLGEVLQHLARDGHLAAGRLDPESLRPSDGVRAFIRRHVEPLGPEELRHLTIAAVLGRTFDVVALGAVARTSPGETLAALSTPTALRLIEPARSQGRFRFAHALIRETLYGDLSPAERARLHLEAGQALENLHRDAAEPPVAEIAFHYYHAAPLGHGERAAAYSARAGERAVAQLAFEDGVVHFERALAVLTLHEPRDRERLKLQLALGGAALRAGDNVKGRASFEAALRLARAVGDAEAFARAAYGIGGTRVEANSADPVLIAALEEALVLADPAPSAQRVALLARLATALYFTGEARRREELSNAAVAMAREVGEATTLAAALITRHLMLWGIGALDERMRVIDEALALASASGHRGLVLESRTWRLVDLLESGDVTAAELELGHYVQDAGETRFPKHRRYSAGVRAALAFHSGQFAEAERLATEARDIPERRQDTSIEQVYLSQLFHVRRETGGDLDSLAGPIAEQARIQRAVASWRCGFALLELERGHVERARAIMAEVSAEDFASVPRDGNLCQTIAYCAEAAAWLGDAEAAGHVYEILLAFEGRNVVVGSPPVVSMGAVARYLGLAAAAAGRLDAAVRHLEDAIALDERMGALPQVAHAQVDLARVLLRLDDGAHRERAAGLLDTARAIAGRLGMRALLARMPTGEPEGEPIASAGKKPPPARGRRAPAPAPASGAPDAPVRPAGRATFRATCRREGDFWTVAHAGHTARIKDARGLVILQLLLRHPGREFHVLELETGAAATEAIAGGLSGGTARAGQLAAAGLVASRGEDAGDVLDPEARSAYRVRLAELEAELAEVRAAADEPDSDRSGSIEREIDFLNTELSRGFGLGGRVRKAASTVERARLNATRSLARVVRRIAEQNPVLGQHLEASLKTGTYCSYSPDPTVDGIWEL
jgi:tetratricopeptide (TPR) repeat protein